ncbi:hypothetical protein QBC45DRAFT_218753 [Copromyces sp. CBS 386.78]|nr:hypothetical protein QBC45DRAFT_218753 [Copromyces sp. CBS 386.78]
MTGSDRGQTRNDFFLILSLSFPLQSPLHVRSGRQPGLFLVFPKHFPATVTVTTPHTTDRVTDTLTHDTHTHTKASSHLVLKPQWSPCVSVIVPYHGDGGQSRCLTSDRLTFPTPVGDSTFGIGAGPGLQIQLLNFIRYLVGLHLPRFHFCFHFPMFTSSLIFYISLRLDKSTLYPLRAQKSWTRTSFFFSSSQCIPHTPFFVSSSSLCTGLDAHVIYVRMPGTDVMDLVYLERMLCYVPRMGG